MVVKIEVARLTPAIVPSKHQPPSPVDANRVQTIKMAAQLLEMVGWAAISSHGRLLHHQSSGFAETADQPDRAESCSICGRRRRNCAASHPGNSQSCHHPGRPIVPLYNSHCNGGSPTWRVRRRHRPRYDAVDGITVTVHLISRLMLRARKRSSRSGRPVLSANSGLHRTFPRRTRSSCGWSDRRRQSGWRLSGFAFNPPYVLDLDAGTSQ